MSSRNAYLSAEERAAAPTLYRVLKDCAAAIARGERIARALDEGGAEIERAGFRLDYLEVRNALTLRKSRPRLMGRFGCWSQRASARPG